MEIIYRKKFKKALRKQSLKIQKKFFKIIEIFQDNQFHYSLNNHALTGEFERVRSINITGDVRIHYIVIDDIVILLMIGSHSELYS